MNIDIEDNNKQPSATANAILNILQQISISPSESPLTQILSNDNKNNTVNDNSNNNTNEILKVNKCALQHLHSLPKSIIPKRRLSSSSSFDGITINSSNDKSNKRQLYYLRGQQQQQQQPKINNNTRSFPSPLSRSYYIKRLSTFSVLNWTINDSKLSPLICAAQGFKCHPIRKNELHCTSCHSSIIIKLPENPDNEFNSNNSNYNYNKKKKTFNNLHHTDNYNQILNNTEKYELPFQFEIEMLDDEFEDNSNDDTYIYETLVNSYVGRLTTDHYNTCSFLPFLPLSPKDENYYISSKDIQREIIKFNNRLNLMKRHKNLLINKNFKRSFLTNDEIEFLKEYLRKYSKDDNEIDIEIEDPNINTNLFINPSLDVILPALLGWELKIQKFCNENFLLLNCECCTRRILLSTIDTLDNDNTNNNGTKYQGIEELNACPYKAEIPMREEMTEFDETLGFTHKLNYGRNLINGEGNEEENEDEDDEDDEMIDLEQEHDNWCCMKQGWRVVLEGLRSYGDVEMPSSFNNNITSSTKQITQLYNSGIEHLKNL